jgi:hypothetical protein
MDIAAEACFLNCGRLEIEAFDLPLSREVEAAEEWQQQVKSCDQEKEQNRRVSECTLSRH